MVKIVAKFKGRNSLGYVHGLTYDINIIERPLAFGSEIKIASDHGQSPCVYSRIETFLQNWKPISYQPGYKLGDKGMWSLESKITQIIRDSKIQQIVS